MAGCGVVRQHGAARQVIEQYSIQGAPNIERIINLVRIPRRAGSDDRLRLVSIEWLCDLPLRHGEAVKARIRFTTRVPLIDVSIGMGFSNINGTRLLSYDTDFQNEVRPNLSRSGSYSVEIEIKSLPIGPDIYSLDIGSRSRENHALDYIPGVAQIEIIASGKTPGYVIGHGATVRLASNWIWNIK